MAASRRRGRQDPRSRRGIAPCSARRRTDEDFAAEIRAHLAIEVDRLIADGLTPDEARAAAQRQFGNVTRVRERFHDVAPVRAARSARAGHRYAWRGLRHSRAFVATTVLTLAVGIGLMTVVFTVFNAYVLRPFAVHDPYALHDVGWRAQKAGGRRSAGATTRTSAPVRSLRRRDRRGPAIRHLAHPADVGGLRLGQLLRRRWARASRSDAAWSARDARSARAASRSSC